VVLFAVIQGDGFGPQSRCQQEVDRKTMTDFGE
jgi:hypothetical protein